MLFKKLYYYYHHYKMWSYIVKQLKVHPFADIFQFKSDYIRKNKCKHLSKSYCYLCRYSILIRHQDKITCEYCPLYKKYGKNCFNRNSLFHKVMAPGLLDISPEERIAIAEKIRDCVLPWKTKVATEEIKED